jgi:signal transduction histidine kinase
MKPRLSIRTRFALMSAMLAVGVLMAGMFTVYLIERHQVEQALRADARTAATGLARAGEGREPSTATAPETTADGFSSESGDDTGESSSAPRRPAAAGTKTAPTTEPDDEVLRSYLRARGGSDQLLVSIGADGTTHANTSLARRLTDLHLPPPGGLATVSLDGERYVVAVARRGRGRVAAALPMTEAEAAVHRLVIAMLIVCAIGLVPATLVAWLAARRALSPLSRIAQRAARVTAGDLSVRMGPVSSHDEISEVAVAIDAMLDRLESTFAAQRRFVHDASHELRTPLTIARGHLEVALPDDADPELRDAVQVAIDEIDRMGRLVDSLLRLARQGRDDAAHAPVDLGAVARGMVDRSRVLGERTWRVEAEPGLFVDGDEDALEQVLLNLIANAVNHTTSGDTISVTADRRDGRIRLEVTDSGEGIDPSLLPNLFDRFVRADSARSRATGGTGLGLAICHSIVEEHGGSIWADNNGDEGGAQFVIELPASRRGSMRSISSASHA